MSYKDRQVEPFVYQPCKNLPGMIAIPVSELEEKPEVKTNEKEKE